MEVAIIDYKVGNIANVIYGFERAGYTVTLTAEAKRIQAAPIVILPGVGAMESAMRSLTETELIPVLQDVVKKGHLLAGICLGMQMLYEYSTEGGHVPALGFLPGTVRRFETSLKVPHMGWNALRFTQPHPLQADLGKAPYVYFVHSYLKCPADTPDVLAVADYGEPVPAIVGRDNVLGMQFHPEKSGATGEQLLRNLKKCL